MVYPQYAAASVVLNSPGGFLLSPELISPRMPLRAIESTENNVRNHILDVKNILQMTDPGPVWLSHKEIGRRVAAIRKSLGVSQDVMAKRLDRPKSGGTIGKIERGQMWGESQQRPDLRLLEDIAILGGLGLDHFRAGDVTNLERAETLIVIGWLDKMADELRERVTTPSQEDVGDVLGGSMGLGEGETDHDD